jgi:hypothetical protein
MPSAQDAAFGPLCELEITRYRERLHRTTADQIVGYLGINPWLINPQQFLLNVKKCPFCGNDAVWNPELKCYESQIAPGLVTHRKPRWNARQVNACRDCAELLAKAADQTASVEAAALSGAPAPPSPFTVTDDLSNLAVGPFAVFRGPLDANSLLTEKGGLFEVNGKCDFTLCLPGYSVISGMQFELEDALPFTAVLKLDGESSSLAFERCDETLLYAAAFDFQGVILEFAVCAKDPIHIKRVMVLGVFAAPPVPPEWVARTAEPPGAAQERNLSAAATWDEKTQTQTYRLTASGLKGIDVIIRVGVHPEREAVAPRRLMLSFKNRATSFARHHLTLPKVEKEAKLTYRFQIGADVDEVAVYYLDAVDGLQPLQMYFRKGAQKTNPGQPAAAKKATG